MSGGREVVGCRGRIWLSVLGAVLLASLLATPFARAAASLSFEPTSWDFGVVVPGSGPTVPKVFTLTNTGDVELTGFFVGLGSEPGSGFAIGENKCGALGPGKSCTISVTFDPSTAGPKAGQLGVTSLGGPSASVALSGTGAGPAVSIEPSARMFDSLEAGAGPSPAKQFTVSNVGQLDLTISSVSIENVVHGNADQFRIAGGSCAAGAVVAPGGACTVDVVFVPTAAGALAAELRIVDDAPGAAQIATVEGVGIAAPTAFPAAPPFVAPRASFIRRPGKRTFRRFAAFWFGGSATAARFVCRLDGGKLHSCASPVRFRHVRPGRHRFAVRAIDGNGRSGSAKVVHWRVVPRRSRHARQHP